MRDRPAVFLRLEDQDGAYGWGEVFANWPAAGAEHRVNLLHRDIATLVLGQTVNQPDVFFTELTQRTHIRALQCGEIGPFNQVIAGIDTALWDMKARRAGLPLRHLLNADAPGTVNAYASGIHINAADDLIGQAREKGFRAFKVKVGFDMDRDISDLCQLNESLPLGERLFSDANQAFDVAQSHCFLDGVRNTRLEWLEEPLVADAPAEQWAKVAGHSSVALAGGENISGQAAFDKVLQDGFFGFIQPDVAKWGGVSGCLQIARSALAVGRIYCPHFLGGGIGLAASAEILAAAGGAGLLEVDVNPNPLRSAFSLGELDKGTGQWICSDAPGLGIDTLPEVLLPTITHKIELTNRVKI